MPPAKRTALANTRPTPPAPAAPEARSQVSGGVPPPCLRLSTPVRNGFTPTHKAHVLGASSTKSGEGKSKSDSKGTKKGKDPSPASKGENATVEDDEEEHKGSRGETDVAPAPPVAEKPGPLLGIKFVESPPAPVPAALAGPAGLGLASAGGAEGSSGAAGDDDGVRAPPKMMVGGSDTLEDRGEDASNSSSHGGDIDGIGGGSQRIGWGPWALGLICCGRRTRQHPHSTTTTRAAAAAVAAVAATSAGECAEVPVPVAPVVDANGNPVDLPAPTTIPHDDAVTLTGDGNVNEAKAATGGSRSLKGVPPIETTQTIDAFMDSPDKKKALAQPTGVGIGARVKAMFGLGGSAAQVAAEETAVADAAVEAGGLSQV